MPTIKQQNSRSVPQRTRERTTSSQNNEDRNPPIINNHSEDRNSPTANNRGAAYNETQPINIIAWWRPAVSGRNVAIHTHVTISLDKRFISHPFKPRWITYLVTKYNILCEHMVRLRPECGPQNFGGGGGGGALFWKSLPYFRPKKSDFSCPISDQTLTLFCLRKHLRRASNSCC